MAWTVWPPAQPLLPACFFAIHAYSLGNNCRPVSLALAAACLGFYPSTSSQLVFSWAAAAVCCLGFALASLSILAPAKVATALLVLGIPILDVVWLIIQRWRLRGNPAMAGRDHLHYRLLNLGFSQRQIVLLYYSFCAAFGLLALLIEDRFFKLVALAVLAGLTLALLGWLAKTDNK